MDNSDLKLCEPGVYAETEVPLVVDGVNIAQVLKEHGPVGGAQHQAGQTDEEEGQHFDWRLRIYFTSSTSLQGQSLDWRRRGISQDFSFQSSGNIFTCHTIVHLTGKCYRSSVHDMADVYIYLKYNIQ